jgi:hypothetical protein
VRFVNEFTIPLKSFERMVTMAFLEDNFKKGCLLLAIADHLSSAIQPTSGRSKTSFLPPAYRFKI